MDHSSTTGFNPIPLGELMERKFPPNAWIVDDLIPDAAITAISGAPATFKTWIYLFLAVSVASGTSLFERFQVKHTGVLIVDEENGERLIQQRLRSIEHLPDLPIYFHCQQGFKIDHQIADKLTFFCQRKGIGLVIFDSLVRIHAEDENDAVKMAMVFESMRRITQAGIAVLFVHHNRKQGKNQLESSSDMRGSSDILAAIDSYIAIKRDSLTITLTQKKLRVAPEHPAFNLTVQSYPDKRVELIFQGDSEDQNSSNTHHVDAILNLLGFVGTPVNQKELHSALVESGVRIGEHALRSTLSILEDNSRIVVEQGARTAKLYSLPLVIEGPAQQLELRNV